MVRLLPDPIDPARLHGGMSRSKEMMFRFRRRVSPWIRYQSALLCLRYAADIQLIESPYKHYITITFAHGHSFTMEWLKEEAEGYYTIRDHIWKWVEQN